MKTKYNPFYRTKPKMTYIPDHWGRLDQGKWVADDRFTPPPKPGSREYLDARKLFKLTASIGERGANDRTDVGKLEALLYMAGVFDLDGSNGPTGYYGERLKQAVKAFQKARGLRVDGDVGPKGETIRTLAQHLQGLGRRGDKVLAHLTPEEAKFLHDNTDGGSINPDTGLMEFNVGGEDADEKKGTYIWRTVGDNRVRSEHAVRDGKTFSWDNPPDGGHPGEAPNCRCTAEDVENQQKCNELQEQIERANLKVDSIKRDVKESRKTLRHHEEEFVQIENDFLIMLATFGLSDLADGGGDFLQRLKKMLNRLNLVGKYLQIKEAWDRRNAAERAMGIARQNLEDKRKQLKEAEEELSKLRKQYDKKCG